MKALRSLRIVPPLLGAAGLVVATLALRPGGLGTDRHEPAGGGPTTNAPAPPATRPVDLAPPAPSVRPGCPYDSPAFCAAFDEQARNVRQAALEYDPPKTMRNHQRVTVEATIDASVLTGIGQPLLHLDRPSTVPVLVTTTMAMALEGEDFDISPATMTEQALLVPPAGTRTAWIWDVTPKRRGDQPLRLRTYIQLDQGGQRSFHEVTPAQVRVVEVRVNPLRDSADAFAWAWKAALALASFMVTVAGARTVLRRSNRGPSEDEPADIDVTDESDPAATGAPERKPATSGSRR